MNNKAIRICIAQFCLVSILWSNIVHTKAIQNPYISVLLISNIDIPKYNGLIIFTNVFFISIAIKWSENFSCQFFMPMIITQQTFVLMKTSWRRLSFSSSKDVLMKTNIFLLITVFRRRLGQDQYIRLVHTSIRCFQDVFKTSCQNVFKTFSRRLQDVFETSSRSLANTSWRHLQDVLKTYHQVKLFLLTSLWEVFNMFVRRTAKTVVYRRIHLGHTSEKFTVSVQNLQEW